MKIQIKKLYPDAQLPYRAHLTDAGADLYAYLKNEPGGTTTIQPGDRPTLIEVGFSMAIPIDYEAQIRPRSGLACKHGITVVNYPGTIDESFRGPVKVGLINLTNYPYTIKHGDRIAQMVINRIELVDFEEVNELNDTDRGSGGFGSSGI